MNEFVNVPASLQHGIKHKAAIDNSKYWLCTVIAALCFNPYCGHINKYGQDSNDWS